MTRARRLGLTASTLPFVVFALSGAAIAQTKPAPAAEEAAPTDAEIVVTGSSLKGVAPVGSNLVTVDRGDIENLGANTVQQVLKSVPAIVGLNSPGQGGFGSFDGAGTNRLLILYSRSIACSSVQCLGALELRGRATWPCPWVEHRRIHPPGRGDLMPSRR